MSERTFCSHKELHKVTSSFLDFRLILTEFLSEELPVDVDAKSAIGTVVDVPCGAGRKQEEYDDEQGFIP